MRLATIRTAAGNRAVRMTGGSAVETGDADVGALLADPDWFERAATADGHEHPAEAVDFAPLVPRPEKIICVGLNYRDHIEETGRQPPEYPTLFAKFPSTLIGAYDDVLLPTASGAVDWEAELAVVIGAPVRHADAKRAAAAIAGYTVLNDVSVRDYQNRTAQWLQGKVFDSTTPLGPLLVTVDELPGGGPRISADISARIDDEVVQHSNTDQLVFDPVALIVYLSEIVTLRPGDVISTGTPGGVGHVRTPPRYLSDGEVLCTRIEGIGECRNTCRKERG